MSVTTDLKRKPESDVIITKFMSELSTFLEMEIKSKWDTLELYKQILEANPDDQVATQQVNTNVEELRGLIKSLLDVRKDSEFINPDMSNIIQSIESTCPDCGKKKEQVGIVGPHSTPKLDKKKKKRKIAQVPQAFEFVESHEAWGKLLSERTTGFTHSSSFVGNVIYDSDTQDMKITLNGEAYVFCNIPDRTFDAFEGAGSKGAFFNREIKGLHDC